MARQRKSAVDAGEPLIQKTSVGKTSENKARGSDRLPSSVLVIDDSPSDRRLMSELLRELRSDVVIAAAASLSEARDVLAETDVELVLLDLGLPDATGLEGLHVLADDVPTTPIVVVTAHPDDSYVYAALNSGADEYLSKDTLSADRVTDALLRALSRRAGRRRYDRLGQVAHRTLNALSAPAATLEVTGRISAVNEAWEEFARAHGAPAETTGVGVNYLTVCRQATGEFAGGANLVANGIESVLTGETERFSHDYPCPIDGQERWYTVRAVPLRIRGGGAVVTHVDVTDVTKAENDIRRREAELESSNELSLAFLHSHTAEIYALVDAEGAILHRSMSTYQLLGNEPLNGEAAQVLTRVDPADIESAAHAFARVSSTPFSSEQLIVRVIDRQGGHRTLDLTVTNLLDDDSVRAIVISGNDVTEGRYIQIAQRIESRLLRILPAAIVVTDLSGTIVYWNDNATRLFGHTADHAIGKASTELKLRPTSLNTIDALVMTSGRWEGDYSATRSDGTSVPVHTIVERIDAADIEFQGIVAASIDASERRQLEEVLAFQQRHDALTSLPNRQLLIEHLTVELEKVKGGANHLAVLVVDFDGFRKVNEQFGHKVGDEILQVWSSRVVSLLSPGTLLARLSGNKFAVCAPASTIEDAFEVATRICDVTSVPLVVGDQSVSFTVSVGVALSGPDSTADGLLRNADVALYSAKESGHAQIEAFDDSYHEEVQRRNKLRVELAKAVVDEEIQAHFQPVIDFATGEIMGFEALARWHHRDRGDVPPEEFIVLAEQSGLIGKLGLAMFEASCRALVQWKDASPQRRLQMAVNVSPLQLMDPLFPEAVRETCARFDVNAGDICLEITESALEDASQAFHALSELKAVGVRIAIDDFGTGYSSLRRLNRFPLDFLKIDRSFVAELDFSSRNSVVISAVMGLAEALSFQTVAEGVETDLQRRRLMELGCTVGQGFLFSPAVPLEEATVLVVSGNKYELEVNSA
jgi:diguanylate cyclase (GGDEF)-like protein/PAS domain S-box-containing protein